MIMFTISVGCIVGVNVLRVMDGYDFCVLHRGHPCKVLLNTPMLSLSLTRARELPIGTLTAGCW